MFKKIISSVLIAGQLGFAGGAIASSPTTSDVSPELTLFSNSIALAGQNLSQEGMQAQLSKLLADYKETAQSKGQTDRMEKALVELNIYTADQAHQLTLEAQTFSTSANEASAQSAAHEVAQLMLKYPAGAQFSACSAGLDEWLGAGGMFTALTGGAIWASGKKAGLDANGYIYSNPSEVHHGEIVTEVGGAVLVVAGLLFFFDVYSGKCDGSY